MYGLRLGLVEVALECHPVGIEGVVQIEQPTPGEIILHLWRFEIMITLFRRRVGRSKRGTEDGIRDV